MDSLKSNQPVIMKRIKNNTLIASAQEQIKFFIVESGLKAGDLMPTEKELEKQLGISRTSIREALRSLEAIGIIESKHGVGRFLRDFNYDAILSNLSYNIEVNIEKFKNIIDVRMALENHFLLDLLEKFTKEDIDDLIKILDTIEKHIQHQEPEVTIIQLHTNFHIKLYQRANNKLLTHLISLFSQVQRTMTALHQYHTSDMSEFILLHRNLVQAINKKDPQIVMDSLQKHFKDVIEWCDEYSSHKDTSTIMI